MISTVAAPWVRGAIFRREFVITVGEGGEQGSKLNAAGNEEFSFFPQRKQCCGKGRRRKR